MAYQCQVFTRKRVLTIPNTTYPPSAIRCIHEDNYSEIRRYLYFGNVYYSDLKLCAHSKGYTSIRRIGLTQYGHINDFSTAKTFLMANLSSYGSDVLSEDTNSSAQQDAMILSVFEQLSNQVTKCNKVNKDNLIANESLSAELERYKEWEKKLLTKTVNVFKNESKEKEAKNIDKEIALENKVKEQDNIVCKIGLSVQTVHMLTKPQVFYDNNLKQALGFQNPLYLKKAQQIRPMLYDGSVIAKETKVISIDDSEEILMLEEESRSKMHLKQSNPMVLDKKVNIKPINYAKLNRLSEDFGKCFVPQQELSDEQAFRLQTSHPNTDQSASSPVKIEAPRELPKKGNGVISQDIVNIVVNYSLDINTYVNVNSSVAMNDSVNYVEMCNKCLELEAELIKQHNMVEKDDYNRLSKRFSKLEQHCISFELAMQLNKEIFQKNNTYVNQTKPSFDQLFELKNLKAELQAKDTTIEKLMGNIKRVIKSTKSGRSKSTDNTKNDRILQISSSTQKKNKVEDHSRIVNFMFDARHELCFLEFVSNMNASSKSKSVKKAKKKEEWKPTRKDYRLNKVPLREPIPLEVIAQESVVTKVYTRKPKIPKTNGSYSKPKIAKSVISNKTEPGTSRGSNTSVAPSSSSVDLRLSKLSCAKKFLVRALPKLKFEKDHLYSACAMGKSKKQSHKPKSDDTNQEKLYLFHMDLYGPMRVVSVNGKKYILVIVDDYSRFTWVKFLASNDEAPDFIIKFLKMIQVRLNATVRNIRTYNVTEFVNQTLRDYYEQLTAMASEQLGSGPELQSMTPATSSSGLVTNHIPQQPCNPPPRNDWDRLFQHMFDEYFNPPTIVVSPVPVDNAPRVVDLADSPMSTSIYQDAPSKKSPKTPHFHDDPLHESLHEDSTSQGSSSNVRPIHTPFESLGRWTKDHPVANVIGDPSRSVSTRKQLQTDAM
ncbi:retrovirus-related pol polyprotein from transposon TNT 1-94 [Tanacetum coccineum]